jgi:hypothetical protein
LQGEVVQLTLNNDCKKRSAIAVDHIPGLQEAVDVSNYIYISTSGMDLYYLIQLQQDCNLLSIEAHRLPKMTVEVAYGDVVPMPNMSWTDYLFVRTKEQYSSVEVVVSGLPLFEPSIAIYAANDNFHTNEQYYSFQNVPSNKMSWIVSSDTLEPKYWYFMVQTLGSLTTNVTVSFLPPADAIQLGVPQVISVSSYRQIISLTNSERYKQWHLYRSNRQRQSYLPHPFQRYLCLLADKLE